MHPKYPQKTEEDNQENRAQGKETKMSQWKQYFMIVQWAHAGGKKSQTNSKQKCNQYL